MEIVADGENGADSTDESQNDNPMNGLQLKGQREPGKRVHTWNMASERSRAQATFGFTVSDITNRLVGEVVQSPVFYVRNLPWRIAVIPLVLLTPAEQLIRALGFYLQCTEDSDSNTWWCYAGAELRLLSHRSDRKAFCRTIQHKFCFAESNCGFEDFINWRDLMDPDNGYVSNNSISVAVYMGASVPHGVGWDSKRFTGHVGLQNQGAQCYMNSLLQTLFFTNQLRSAIYNIPAASEGSGKSVVLAMRDVFLGLQFSDKSVDTKTLTTSLGWTALDSFAQQDVHEFLRTLLDKLDSDMKGTCVEGTVPKLLEGAMVTTIRCKDVDYTSTRRETFHDIQLSVADKKNIYESFREYVEWESLAGSNKYEAGEHGLQEAEKHVMFESLPPVLHLHLKRFQYDPVTKCSVKLNDRYEFYEHISLGEYLQEAAPADYTLHAVLVHSGWNQSGHYVAFIDPRANGNWCKFDDEVVSRCSKSDAIECNYGGQGSDMIWDIQHNTNAYMLVYIRDTDMASVLQDVTEPEIPRSFTKQLAEQKRIGLKRRKEVREAKLYMTVNVVVEDAFDGHQGCDLYDPQHVPPRVFRVLRRANFSDLMELLRKSFGYPLERMRLWSFIERSNKTRRPIRLEVQPEQSNYVIRVANYQNPWYTFLELLPPDSELEALPDFDGDDDVLLFFKLYDPLLKCIHYCGHGYVSASGKLRDLVPVLNERAGFPPGTELMLYEEVRPNIIEKIDNWDESLDTVLQELMDGDIILFQKAEEIDKSDLPSCVDYFRHMLYRVEIHFADCSIENDPGFIMQLSMRMMYEEWKYKLALYIGIVPQLLHFFICLKNKVIGLPLRCKPKELLKDTLFRLNSKKIFYLQRGKRSDALEHTLEFKCRWLALDFKKEIELILRPNKWDTIADLLEMVRNQVELSPDEGSGRLRLLRLWRHKLRPSPKDDQLLLTLTTGYDVTYRVEEIPLDQFNLQDDEMLMPCAHFNKQVISTFGVPFYILAKQGEPFHDLRDRIQKRLAVPDVEWNAYKFAVVLAMRPWYITADTYLVNLQDFRPHVTRTGFQLPWLGLDHENSTLEPKMQID